MNAPPDEDFLSRWSRRKRAGAQDEPVESADTQSVDPSVTSPPDETDEELLARLELPDPDTLEKGDDFSRFMASAVPEHIRRRALRRLWRSNPALVVLDGLNEYDEDYTKGFVPAGTLKTAYKVGRGFLSRSEEHDTLSETEDETIDAPEKSDEVEVATYAPDKNAQEMSSDADAVADDTPHEGVPDQAPLDQPGADQRATRRRMRFRLPDTS
ncbi:MAG: DUF3306 domain-containing protein [Pseudomonadota bacterium]